MNLKINIMVKLFIGFCLVSLFLLVLAWNV
jgi:hypothetical protein